MVEHQFSFLDEPQQLGPIRILTVCTGNICRSPLAELLLRKVLTGLPVEVGSGGTSALVGHAMTEPNQLLAAEFGVLHPESHRAKQLVASQIREADLVLALAREHRRAVVELVPRASRHTFTLREFGRLTEAVNLADMEIEPGAGPEAKMRAAIELVAQSRGALPPLQQPEDDDVVDPYRQGDEVYVKSAQQLVPALNATAGLLREAATGRR